MIQIENLSKMYKTYRRRSDRLKEWMSFGNRKYHDEYWALNDITLTVPAGSVYGLIGMNGAGKSTLLKVLTGTTQPTRGRVRVEGRIAALLELGTGFHPEFTGRENVLINGKLLGLTDAELAERLEGADLVVTGEGFVDAQSFEGKVVGGVAALARELGVPVLVVCGQTFDDAAERVELISLVERFGTEAAMTETADAIRRAVSDALGARRG